MTDLFEELLASKRSDPALEAHQVIIDKLVGAVMEKNNRFKIKANGEGESFTLDEIKKLDVSHFADGGQTFVTIETGLIGDEGTPLTRERVLENCLYASLDSTTAMDMAPTED